MLLATKTTASAIYCIRRLNKCSFLKQDFSMPCDVF